MTATVAERSRAYRLRHPERFGAANRAHVRRWQLANPGQNREMHRKWREANPDRHIKWLYDLTLADYAALLAEQGGVCASCGRPETVVRKNGQTFRLAVDHEHGTGRVRGLLCARCNRGIGNFDDDPERLIAAAAYLRRTA